MKRFMLVVLCLVFTALAADLSFAAKRKAVVGKAASGADADKMAAGSFIMAADFEKEGTVLFGAWNKDPNDDTQGCKLEIVTPGYNGKGKCAKLTYDIDSPNEAFNGFWMKLNGENTLDLSDYTKLYFWVKGDKTAGYSTKVKVELKDTKMASSVMLDNITDSWKRVELPLDSFNMIKDWKQMKEFVITFDNNVTQKVGVIYVDNVYFSK